jgi:hypothetical protein
VYVYALYLSTASAKKQRGRSLIYSEQLTHHKGELAMKREIALEEHMSLSKEPAFPLSLLSIVHSAVLCCRPLAATLSMRRVVPVRIMLIPTNVPITHSELDGHCRQTIRPRIKVTIPSIRI